MSKTTKLKMIIWCSTVLWLMSYFIPGYYKLILAIPAAATFGWNIANIKHKNDDETL